MTAPRTHAAPIGEPPAIQYVGVDKLRVDERYQRSIDTGTSRKLIERIAAGWDWRLCPPLLVSQRVDGLFVIDGQHRARAAQLRGDIPHMPVSALFGLSLAEEARIFAAVNHERKTVTRLDSFRAALAAEDAGATTIARLATAAGLAIAASQREAVDRPGTLAFIVGLRQALDGRGEELVGAALATMGDAFREDQIGEVGATIFGALILLLGAGERQRRDVTAALRRRTAAEWSEIVRRTGVRGAGVRARTLRDAVLAELAPPPAPDRVIPQPARTKPGGGGGTDSPAGRIDLNRVPSSMEQRAAGWSAPR